MSDRPGSERALVTAITVPPAQLREWDALAQRRGLSRSEFVRNIVNDHVARVAARAKPEPQSNS